jgi:amino acid adenylation domain-containing protein
MKLLHEGFYQSALTFPERIAVETPQQKITYQELVLVVEQLRSYFQLHLHHSKQLIAIVLPRHWEEIAMVLAILASGNTYAPIDSRFPAQRINTIMTQSQANVLITSRKLSNLIELSNEHLQKVLYIEDIFAHLQPAALPQHIPYTPSTPIDIAYVIFTSGTTGIPKGVMITHQSALNTIYAINELIKLNSESKILGISDLSFDLSVYDIFGTFSVGATLVLPDASCTHDQAKLLAFVKTTVVTVWNSVPQLFAIMLDYLELFPEQLNLQTVMLSGDWVLPSLIRRANLLLSKKVNYHSLGGATESSIWSIQHKISYEDLFLSRLPYGLALKNQTVSVLDEEFKPCPVGVSGKIYIGGMGLAKGYLNDKIQTNKSFLLNPGTLDRIYDTGDIGKYRSDMVIEFLGRQDAQIKLRGFRIELKEIDYALMNHTKIKNAVSVFKQEIITYLELFEDLTLQDIHDYLSTVLPEYMIPNNMVFINKFPLSANGKIDTAALRLYSS